MQSNTLQRNARRPRRSALRRSRRFVFRLLGLAAFAPALLLLCTPLVGADTYWNVASGDWSVAGNWSTGALPNTNSTAYVVNGGTATISLPGAACSELSLGDTAGCGSIQMAAGDLTAVFQYVGKSGTGTFAQSGGTNTFGPNHLYLGYNAGSSGTYILSGTGRLRVNNGGYSSNTGEYIGYSGTGTFTQSGATYNYASRRMLYLGYNAGSSGAYALSDTAELATDGVYVGYSGTGSFVQSGGRVWNTSTGPTFCLGYNPGSNGSYALSGTGQLSYNGPEYIGYSGTGNFTQSGGANGMGYNPLYLGYSAGSSGTYSLSGSGQLSAEREYVGYDLGATGLFQQTGGANTCAYLSIGKAAATRSVAVR